MKIEKIKDVEFFNRESETEQIVNILKFKPRLINFVYGPINSGKTSLIMNLIEDLPDDYVVFYINLRGKFISDYRDFIKVLFTVDKKGISTKIKNFLKKNLKVLGSAGEKTLYKSKGIPVDVSLLETFFNENTHEDVFKYLEEYFKATAKHKTPVLIIDELQVIGDLKIDDYLIYKLFNFFIRLTKELHLCHVFALSSDSLFIERVYGEAVMHERCEYLLVDEFDKQTTYNFLKKYKFSKDERELTWQYFGGKPLYLADIIETKARNEDIKKTAYDEIQDASGHLRDMLDKLLYVSPKIMIDDEEHGVKRDEIIKLLEIFKDKEKIDDRGLRRPEKIYLIKNNILFIDPRKSIIKPQSKIDLNAIREILKELK